MYKAVSWRIEEEYTLRRTQMGCTLFAKEVTGHCLWLLVLADTLFYIPFVEANYFYVLMNAFLKLRTQASLASG